MDSINTTMVVMTEGYFGYFYSMAVEISSTSAFVYFDGRRMIHIGDNFSNAKQV